MRRLLNPRLLLGALALAFVLGACATNEGAQERPSPVAPQAAPMDHDGMEGMQAMMPQMMRMHEHMMADSVIHQRMMADPELRQSMHEMMGGEMDMDAMHERMAAMPPDERRAMMEGMHARMMARMEAMPTDEQEAMMHRMMAAHGRLMEDPVIHERMMADPEMREMMEGMQGGMMDHDGMMHDGMDH